MNSYNQVIILGNAGRDTECRTLSDGKTKVATLSIATTQRGFTRRDGSKVEQRSDWHTVVLWRNLAAYAEKYIKKGDLVQVIGELRNRNWTDKDGSKHYTTEIMASEIMLLSGAKKEERMPEEKTPSAPLIKEEQYPQKYEGTESESEELPF